MSFFCGCGDSEYELAMTIIEPSADHKVHRCRECRCELAPGHVMVTEVHVMSHEDGPFDDLDEETQAEVLAWDDTWTVTMCERCHDLSEAVVDTGYCYYLGDLWASYTEWLAEQGKAPRAAPGRLGTQLIDRRVKRLRRRSK